jgi:poly(A) polymerase
MASVAELKRQGLGALFPLLAPLMGNGVKHKNQRVQFVERALADTDARVAEDRAVVPSYLLACLLWHEVRERWQQARAGGMHPVPALQSSIDAVFDARIGDISGRGKLAADMREIWLMQPRFERRIGASPFSLIEQPRYRAAFDFLRLRADCGEIDAELADWWEDFALGTAEEREALIAAVRETLRSTPRRAPAQRDPSPPTEATRSLADEPAGAVDESAAPRKRRRRRRRAGGGGGGGTAPVGEAGA